MSELTERTYASAYFEEVELEVALDEDEIRERSEQLAATYQELHDVEVRKKNLDRELNDKLKELDGKCIKLSDAITTRSETRKLKCRWHYDYGAQWKYLVRPDTFDTVRDERLQSDDVQVPMSFDSHRNGVAEKPAESPSAEPVPTDTEISEIAGEVLDPETVPQLVTEPAVAGAEPQASEDASEEEWIEEEDSHLPPATVHVALERVLDGITGDATPSLVVLATWSAEDLDAAYEWASAKALETEGSWPGGDLPPQPEVLVEWLRNWASKKGPDDDRPKGRRKPRKGDRGGVR